MIVLDLVILKSKLIYIRKKIFKNDGVLKNVKSMLYIENIYIIIFKVFKWIIYVID